MADYDGGIGGKFRRRPFRRPAATPYDRPPAALRPSRGRTPADLGAEGSGGGWFSKLVDPASRLITTGASRFFSSVFQKRLNAPPLQAPAPAPAPASAPAPAPEGNRQSRQDVPELACTVPSSELQKEEDRDNKRNSFDNDGIAALEQLLKEKTFTRVEFDRLAELLRSRTVEPLKVTEVNNQEQCQAQHQQCFNNEKIDNVNISAHGNKIGSSKVHERLLVQQGSLPDQTASPAELAKAYMGMGPPKTSSSALGIRNQVFKEDRKLPSIPSISKSLDLSVAPRSTIRFSGGPKLTENGYRTPRPLGRSAIYRMSRSPYFKVNSTSNVKGGELNGDGYTCKSLSQWVPRTAMRSGGKQELKRGSSVLDGDFGTVSPIRRIRQKCNLSSPSKDSRPSPSGSLLSGPLTPLSNKFIEGSTSVQKPLLVAPIPLQSSETAHRLFQQLDKLLPLPTERSSKMKTIDRDGSPSKLTPDMLHGGALRSMEEIDTSKFSSVQDIGTASDSHLPTIGSFSSGKVDMVEENGRSKFSTLGVKLASETNGLKNASPPSTDANPGRRSTYSIVSDYAVPPQSKRPSFQMSAPEDSLELDDDDYNTTNVASPLTKENNGVESKKPEPQNVISETTASETALKMPEKNNIVSETASSEAELKIPNHKEVVYETTISASPLVSSSQSIAVSSSILFRESDKKAFAQPLVSEKGTGFTFPITSDSCSHSLQPPAPIEPTPLLNQPAFQKEQTSLFSSGSSAANIFAVSSTIVGVNDSAGVKIDAGTGSELKSSSSDATSTSAEGSNLIKAGETQKAGDLFKSFEHVSSGLSMSTTSALFSFGASTATQSPSNGSLGGPSSTSSLSMPLGTTQSETPASSIFLSGTAVKANSRPSFSSAAPVFSTVPSFQFGSGAPNATSLDKSKLSALEAEPAKTSPFSISNSTALGTSAFPGTSSSYSTAFTSSSSGSAPPALTMSGINSSTTSSSSTLGTSSLFSSMGTNSSSFALSAPGSGSSIFGFSGSTQSSSSSPSLASSNSQNSTTTFGATGGSIFGAQPIHSANGTSLMSKSSTSHLTSFSSSPAFGLSNSSSNRFGVTAGGSPPSAAKPFTPSPAFSVSTGASPAANTSSSFVPVATSALFGSSSQASTSSIFGSTSTSSTSPSTGFSFGLSAPGSGSSASISTTSSLSTGFSFGQSASGSGSSPFVFGSSSLPSFGSSSGPASGSVFSFTSANPTASSTPASTQPAFGVLNPAIGFGSVMSGSPGNDQMNVEDTMTDDTNQAPSFPTFGQPTNHSASPGFTFGSPAVQPGGSSVFQFGSHPNPSVPQTPPLFQATGNLEIPQGGSFSLGSGGGDKAGRKFVRVARNKQRKK